MQVAHERYKNSVAFLCPNCTAYFCCASRLLHARTLTERTLNERVHLNKQTCFSYAKLQGPDRDLHRLPLQAHESENACALCVRSEAAHCGRGRRKARRHTRSSPLVPSRQPASPRPRLRLQRSIPAFGLRVVVLVVNRQPPAAVALL